MDSFQITGLKPVADPLIISYTFRTAAFAIPQREKMYFRPGNILAFGLPDYFRSLNRIHPIHFRYGSKMELELTLNLPNGWEVYSLIPPHSLSSRFGTADWLYSTNDRVFKASVNYHINGENVTPEDYQDFQAFWDEIRKWDLKEVIFTPKYYQSGD